MRRKSLQYKEEEKLILLWLEAIIAAADKNYDLACSTAKLSIWSRGYGNVRRDGQHILEGHFSNWSQKLSKNLEELLLEIDQSLILAHANPDKSDRIN